MKKLFFITTLCCFYFICSQAQNTYLGKPYDKIPVIPGKIQCEFYDQGGEGIAYHDEDTVNGGSGRLNPANGTYLNEFRMNEAVGISYTKTNGTDDNPFNFFNPEMGQLYVGWTKPNDWVKYSIDVKTAGDYIIGTMYTANGDGIISLSVDNMEPVKMKIPSTHVNNDTVAWRQWHHWNKLDSIGTITLPSGIHILKLKIIENGNMNFDFLEVKLKRK